MLPFIEFAAIAMLAASPHQASAHRKNEAGAHPVAAKSDSNARHVAACRRAHRDYDARSDTYRDARGKRRRCTL